MCGRWKCSFKIILCVSPHLSTFGWAEISIEQILKIRILCKKFKYPYFYVSLKKKSTYIFSFFTINLNLLKSNMWHSVFRCHLNMHAFWLCKNSAVPRENPCRWAISFLPICDPYQSFKSVYFKPPPCCFYMCPKSDSCLMFLKATSVWRAMSHHLTFPLYVVDPTPHPHTHIHTPW